MVVLLYAVIVVAAIAKLARCGKVLTGVVVDLLNSVERFSRLGEGSLSSDGIISLRCNCLGYIRRGRD
jgi:hypothetical protein